jgi:signal peptidase I
LPALVGNAKETQAVSCFVQAGSLHYLAMDPETPSENESPAPPAAVEVPPATESAPATKPAPPPSEAEKPHRRGAGARDYLESLLVTVILALFGTTFVVQAFKIPSPSMEPTLLVGDHLLVNKFLYGGRGAWYDRLLPYREIERGDIIVFRFPYDDHIHYVKRVIGIPGDRIKIVDQQLYINGKPAEEPYKVHDESEYDAFGGNFPPTTGFFPTANVRREWKEQILLYVEQGELVVPPGRYFVMGDNRDHSLDSRFWGFVDRENVMGRPMLIYFSVEATSDDYTDRSLRGRSVGLIRTMRHLPAKTRWSRMFQPVR